MICFRRHDQERCVPSSTMPCSQKQKKLPPIGQAMEANSSHHTTSLIFSVHWCAHVLESTSVIMPVEMVACSQLRIHRSCVPSAILTCFSTEPMVSRFRFLINRCGPQRSMNSLLRRVW